MDGLMAIYADAPRAFGPADVTVSDEISYGPNERHLLRVYEGVNRNPSGGSRGAPVLVLVHGGGFRGSGHANPGRYRLHISQSSHPF